MDRKPDRGLGPNRSWKFPVFSGCGPVQSRSLGGPGTGLLNTSHLWLPQLVLDPSGTVTSWARPWSPTVKYFLLFYYRTTFSHLFPLSPYLYLYPHPSSDPYLFLFGSLLGEYPTVAVLRNDIDFGSLLAPKSSCSRPDRRRYWWVHGQWW
jgi:hypothetical protein